MFRKTDYVCRIFEEFFESAKLIGEKLGGSTDTSDLRTILGNLKSIVYRIEAGVGYGLGTNAIWLQDDRIIESIGAIDQWSQDNGVDDPAFIEALSHAVNIADECESRRLAYRCGS